MTSAATTDDLTVTVERQPGSRVELRIEAPASEVETAATAAARRLAAQVRIPGFRPGKAPAALVERVVGWEAVRQEAIDRVVPQLYLRALEQAEVDAVGDPEVNVTEFERGKPLTFTATVTVRPDVDLGDYRESLRVDEERTEVTDERVDEMVEEVRRRHSELVDVTDRPAQAGDVLRATLTMRRGDEMVGGGEEERDIELDRDRLLPGVVDGLIGVEAGADQTFGLTLPEDYQNEELRGQEVQVQAHVSAIRERRLPPLDDSLAALDGHGETLEELREHYRESLVQVAEENDERRYEGAVLEKLRDLAQIDVPEAMVDIEIDRQLREMDAQLAGAGLRLDRYLEYSGQTIEQIRAERREAAVQRVKLQLALEALADSEGIEVDEGDVEREEQRLVTGRKLSAEQRHRLHHAAHHDLLLRGAVQRAVEIARGEG